MNKHGDKETETKITYALIILGFVVLPLFVWLDEVTQGSTLEWVFKPIIWLVSVVAFFFFGWAFIVGVLYPTASDSDRMFSLRAFLIWATIWGVLYLWGRFSGRRGKR